MLPFRYRPMSFTSARGLGLYEGWRLAKRFVNDQLNEHCPQWPFQREISATGFRHGTQNLMTHSLILSPTIMSGTRDY
jgi:hypothetical protein